MYMMNNKTKVWRLAPHCLIWCNWHERNVRCFEGCKHSMLEIKSFFLQSLLDWIVALSHSSFFSLLVLLNHCNFGSWFLPPQYIPNVLGFATFLIIFYITYQKFFFFFQKYCQNSKTTISSLLPSLSKSKIRIIDSILLALFLMHIWYHWTCTPKP